MRINKKNLEELVGAPVFSSQDFVDKTVDELVSYEQLMTRGEAVHSSEDQQKISRARILIFGAGGTGSFVLESLARAGAGYEGYIVGVDFDTVGPENLYRQAVGRVEYLGMKKVEAAAREVAQYGPKTKFIGIDAKVDEENIDGIMDLGFDIVLVAFDDQKSRVLAHRKAREKGIASIDIRVSPSGGEITDRVFVTTYLPDGISYEENMGLVNADLKNAHKERARVCVEEYGARKEWLYKYQNGKTGWSIPGLGTQMSAQLMARECLKYITKGKPNAVAPAMYCFDGVELTIKNPPEEGWDFRHL